jgi:hypothetical protein
VFTARYELIPYIKQNTFSLLEVNTAKTLAKQNLENHRGSVQLWVHNTVKYSEEFTQKHDDLTDSRLKSINRAGCARNWTAERPSSIDTMGNMWLWLNVTQYSTGILWRGHWMNEAAVREQVTALLECEMMMMISINSNIVPNIQYNT